MVAVDRFPGLGFESGVNNWVDDLALGHFKLGTVGGGQQGGLVLRQGGSNGSE